MGLSIPTNPSTARLYQRMWDTYYVHNAIADVVVYYLTLEPYQRKSVLDLLRTQTATHQTMLACIEKSIPREVNDDV